MTDSRQVTARPYPFSAPDRLDRDAPYARPRRDEPLTLVDEMSGLLVRGPLPLLVAW